MRLPRFGPEFDPSQQSPDAGCRNLPRARGAAHDANRRSPGLPARQVGGNSPVEMIIGIALIVIAGLEIWFIVRTVQSNLGRT